MCTLITHMESMGIRPDDGARPPWVTDMVRLMDNAHTAPNVKMFIARVVSRCNEVRHLMYVRYYSNLQVLRRYSTDLWRPIADLICSSTLGGNYRLHSMRVELIVLLLKWMTKNGEDDVTVGVL